MDEYIKTAEPVGSKFLVSKYNLDVSSATVRNDMAFLEQEGYLKAPHTSSGRIPTEKGYLYYLQNFMKVDAANAAHKSMQKSVEHKTDERVILKIIAKDLMQLSDDMVVTAFGDRWSYYVGVANLFQKPEFHDMEQIQTLTSMIDTFDDVLHEIFDTVPLTMKVMIGSENPFHSNLSSILVRFEFPNKKSALLGMIGPIRMNYGRNMGLLQRALEILDHTV